MKTKTFLDSTVSKCNPHNPHSFKLGIAEDICESTESWLSELCPLVKYCPHENDPDTCPELIHECDYLIAEIRANVKRFVIH